MSEQHGLKWSQVDLERRQLYLPKNGDPSGVPLNGMALAAIRKLRTSSKSESVFPDAPPRLVPRSC
jgi:hypothetical protein